MNRQAPENTLSAFRKAAESGVARIETDVDILGNGTAIVMHDSRLDRTTNRSGYFYGSSKRNLEGIDAGSRFSSEFAGEPPALSPT